MITQPNEDLDPRVQERLLVLCEECAEVQHSISKIFRFGTTSRYPYLNSPDNLTEFHQEVGDVIAMIDSLVDLGFMDREKINQAIDRKNIKLKIWLRNQ